MRLESKELEQLVAQHRAPLRLLAATICKSPEDAVQQAFVKLVTLQQSPNNPAGWLYQVVKNNAITLHQTEKRRKKRETFAGIQSNQQKQLSQSSRTAIDFEQLHEALKLMSEESRQILIARVWGDVPFESLADQFNCSSSTAHRKYQQALEQLRAHLGLHHLVEK